MRSIKLSETYSHAGEDALACWVGRAVADRCPRCLGPECVAWEWASPLHRDGVPIPTASLPLMIEETTAPGFEFGRIVSVGTAYSKSAVIDALAGGRSPADLCTDEVLKLLKPDITLPAGEPEWDGENETLRFSRKRTADERKGYCRALPHHPEGDDA